MKIETGNDLAAAALAVARDHKTLYVLGGFGAPMNSKNKARYSSNNTYNRQTTRTAKIMAATASTFGFDCCGLIKGLLWGWTGDTTKNYGGAAYESNDVPDKNANQMIKICEGVSSDFEAIVRGELLWIDGHVGIYIGDGLAVECTARWEDGVQVTAVHNIGAKDGYNGREWTKHGKLPYVTYEEPVVPKTVTLTMRQLKRGDKGEDVRALQILLSGRGYNGNMHEPDGVFGPNTEGAVMLAQKAYGLSVDGIAGIDTMTSLLGK